MIQILYFASVREQLGCSEEEIEASEYSNTISSLMNFLAQRGNKWQDVFSNNSQLLFSVNQVIAKANQKINDGDEVAFFPQVTGG